MIKKLVAMKSWGGINAFVQERLACLLDGGRKKRYNLPMRVGKNGETGERGREKK